MSTRFRFPIYDPALGAGPTDVRSSVDKLSLSDVQYALLQNLRQDARIWTARSPEASISTTGPSGATSCLGAWNGTLSGTFYSVSAWVVSGSVGIYYQNLSTGAFTEITDPGNVTNASTWGGNSNGKTRLATTTGTVVFCPATAPKRSLGGTTLPPRDYLYIHNGSDSTLVWCPSNGIPVVLHRNINIPAGGLNVRQNLTFSVFWQVATNAAVKTYSNSNARYAAADSAVAPYTTAGNVCFQLAATVLATTGDTARIDFKAAKNFTGEQMSMLVQGSPAAVLDLTVNALLEGSSDDVTYYPFYDQSSSDLALSNIPTYTVQDAGNNRQLITYSLANVSTANRSWRYLRFTRKNGVPAAAYTITILAIGGCGTGSGFLGGTEFTCSYTDRYSFAESGGITAGGKPDGLTPGGSNPDQIKNIGGPTNYTLGSGSTTGIQLPISTAILYDFRILLKNVDTGTITGGLSGTPGSVDIYFRTPQEVATPGTRAYFWSTVELYQASTTGGGTHQWTTVVASSVYTIGTESFGYGSVQADRFSRDFGVPAPSAFNIAMPTASAIGSFNGRVFAGNVKDPAGNSIPSDIYVSRRDFPNRFQSEIDVVGGVPDEASGTRLSVPGEQIKAFISAAASANGASKVYFLTDQSFNAFGKASPFDFRNTLAGVSEISFRDRISSDGTNDPQSVAELNGTIMWLNQNGHFVQFAGGGVKTVSRHRFDDIAASIPASRRGKVQAVMHKFRYYAAYTPSGGAGNTSMLVWNLDDGVLESIDTCDAERMCKVYDSSQIGPGQRLLTYGSTGKVQGYEDGSGTTTVRIVTKARTVPETQPAGETFYVDRIELAMDSDTGQIASLKRYYDGITAPFVTTPVQDKTTPTQWVVDGPRNPAPASGLAEGGRSAYVDMTLTMAGGHIIRAVYADCKTIGAEGRETA